MPLFFVYGTLMRDGCRAKMWPHAPVTVEQAETRGALYDLGSYPGMIVAGDDLIAGEVWQIAAEHLQATVAALDEIEGYYNTADDLYQRAEISCHTASGSIKATTYLYAQPLDQSQRIKPGGDGLCRWEN